MVQRREHELIAAAVLAERRPKIVAAMFAKWSLALDNLHEWRWQLSRASLRHRLHRCGTGPLLLLQSLFFVSDSHNLLPRWCLTSCCQKNLERGSADVSVYCQDMGSWASLSLRGSVEGAQALYTDLACCRKLRLWEADAWHVHAQVEEAHPNQAGHPAEVGCCEGASGFQNHAPNQDLLPRLAAPERSSQQEAPDAGFEVERSSAVARSDALLGMVAKGQGRRGSRCHCENAAPQQRGMPPPCPDTQAVHLHVH